MNYYKQHHSVISAIPKTATLTLPHQEPNCGSKPARSRTPLYHPRSCARRTFPTPNLWV